MRAEEVTGETAATASGDADESTPAPRARGAQGHRAPRPTRSMLTSDILIGDAVTTGPQFEDGTPIPRLLLNRLACDSEINRIIFGPQSEVLDVGRAERTFMRSRRTGIITRDKHCQYPRCTAPPALSECHHVQQWARDHGDTSVANGILLCFHHHDLVHRRGIGIRREGTRWAFTDRHGDPLTGDDWGAPPG